jgi:3',5'-cyclic AMP phosphodiesterase CpdA
MNRVIVELNELGPDVVICSGDLTTEGFRQEFKSWVAYAQRLESPVLTVPGNHDARNVGYLHFEELIGERHWAVDVRGVRIVGIDSSEPDINEGQVGRERYEWIRERFDVPADLKVFVLHHHLLPIPGTGRERSTVMDAGDLLEVLITAGVNIVLSGHKHVPYVWRLENLYVANAGTVASLRVRGYTKPCYNVLEFEGDEVTISRRYPFGGSSVIAHFSLSTGEQFHRELEPPVQQRAGAASGEQGD